LVKFSFVILLLLGECSPSGGSNNSQPGKNVETKSETDTPKMDLQAAIVSGNLEAVKQHIEAGTDINRKDQMSGSTPLITAATFGKTAIAKALIDANADLDLKKEVRQLFFLSVLVFSFNCTHAIELLRYGILTGIEPKCLYSLNLIC